ncbi:MAG: hypothetical protein [Arizlama microvirus]|nr:MAG: hypothetical protein [Arizlama microvirus]
MVQFTDKELRRWRKRTNAQKLERLSELHHQEHLETAVSNNNKNLTEQQTVYKTGRY